MALESTPTWLIGPEIPPAERIGTVLNGTYRLDAFLGQGLTGITYNAWHLRHKLPFAVKLIHRGLAPSHERVSRLRHDLRVLSALGRHGFLPVELGFAPDGAPFLAGELLVGETLRQRLARGPLPSLAAGIVVATLARALDLGHARGVVHGDLRPENVVLPAEPGKEVDAGQPTLLDAALHRLRRRPIGLDESLPLGKLAYLAPEQASGEVDVADAAGDLFALGAILYECLTGRPAFAAGEMEGVLEKLAQPPERLVLPREVGAPPGLAEALDVVLAAACARNPEARIPSMGAFLDALSQAYAGAGLPLPPPEERLALPGAGQARGGRRSTIAQKKVVPLHPTPEPEEELPAGRSPALGLAEVPERAEPPEFEDEPVALNIGPRTVPQDHPVIQELTRFHIDAPEEAPAQHIPSQPPAKRAARPTVRARDISRLLLEVKAGRLDPAQAVALAGAGEEVADAGPQPTEEERIAQAGRAAVLARAEAARQAREAEEAQRAQREAEEARAAKRRVLEEARSQVLSKMRAELDEKEQQVRAERAERARQEAERVAAARREAERLEGERREAERREAEEAEKARRLAGEAEAARREAERLEGERLAAEYRETERREAETREGERLDKARQAAARAAAARQDAEERQRRSRDLVEAAERARQADEQARAAATADAADGGAAEAAVPAADQWLAAAEQIEEELRKEEARRAEREAEEARARALEEEARAREALRQAEEAQQREAQRREEAAAEAAAARRAAEQRRRDAELALAAAREAEEARQREAARVLRATRALETVKLASEQAQIDLFEIEAEMIEAEIARPVPPPVPADAPLEGERPTRILPRASGRHAVLLPVLDPASVPDPPLSAGSNGRSQPAAPQNEPAPWGQPPAPLPSPHPGVAAPCAPHSSGALPIGPGPAAPVLPGPVGGQFPLVPAPYPSPYQSGPVPILAPQPMPVVMLPPGPVPAPAPPGVPLRQVILIISITALLAGVTGALGVWTMQRSSAPPPSAVALAPPAAPASGDVRPAVAPPAEAPAPPPVSPLTVLPDSAGEPDLAAAAEAGDLAPAAPRPPPRPLSVILPPLRTAADLPIEVARPAPPPRAPETPAPDRDPSRPRPSREELRDPFAP